MAGTVTRLLAGSPLDQTHQLLVGQTLDGWPQVQAFDAHGVVVRAVAVTFTAAGAASYGGSDSTEIVTDNRGHAISLGLYGEAEGAATVTVSCQDAEPLTYTVAVVRAGPDDRREDH